MKRLEITVLLIGICCVGKPLSAEEPAKLAFDTYSGYYVSNKFEPDAAKSFVVIHDQEQFDKVFGVAFVMRDKSHRLPKDAFKSLLVIASVARGKAVVEYKVEGVTEANGVVELRYTTSEKRSDTATFASPLIVSVPKGEYKAVQFVENGKSVKKIVLAAAEPDKQAKFEKLLADQPVIPEGVVYKKTTIEINRNAFDKLCQVFLAGDHKVATDDLTGSMLICGPGLWHNLKGHPEMQKLKQGVTKIKVPTNNGVQELEGKLFPAQGGGCSLLEGVLAEVQARSEGRDPPPHGTRIESLLGDDSL